MCDPKSSPTSTKTVRTHITVREALSYVTHISEGRTGFREPWRNIIQHSRINSTPSRMPLRLTVGFVFSGHAYFKADHQKSGERKAACY